MSELASQQLDKLDGQHRERILKFLQRLVRLDSPRECGEALHGPRFSRSWKYRIGNYRAICQIQDENTLVRVLAVGHRKDVYR